MDEQEKFSKYLSSSGYDRDEINLEELEETWKIIERGDPARSVAVTEKEITDAFREVASRLKLDSAAGREMLSVRFMKYAAAAVVLILAIGLGYLAVPLTVTVPHGQIETVQLPDQTKVTLNSGSELSYSRLFNLWSREVSLEGEALFAVQESDIPFRVVTGNAIVEVLGTRFNVRYWPSDPGRRTSVFLEKGSVSFRSKENEGKAVTLQPGEQSWISAGRANPAPPKKADPRKALAWKTNSIAFENQSLGAIFAELERRFNITIETTQKDILSENLTIYLSHMKRGESALADICRAMGLNYQKENGKFTVARN